MKEKNINEKLINTGPEQKNKINEQNFEKNDEISSKEHMVAKMGGSVKNSGTIDLSEDCIIGPDAAPSEILKDIISINPNNILKPLLTVRKRCFKELSVEDCLKWQKKTN